jgi:hypothetical protein
VFSGQHLATSNKSHSVHQSNQVLCFLFLPTLHQVAISPSLSTSCSSFFIPSYSLCLFVTLLIIFSLHLSFFLFLFLLLMSSVFQRLGLFIFYHSHWLLVMYFI